MSRLHTFSAELLIGVLLHRACSWPSCGATDIGTSAATLRESSLGRVWGRGSCSLTHEAPFSRSDVSSCCRSPKPVRPQGQQLAKLCSARRLV